MINISKEWIFRFDIVTYTTDPSFLIMPEMIVVEMGLWSSHHDYFGTHPYQPY